VGVMALDHRGWPRSYLANLEVIGSREARIGHLLKEMPACWDRLFFVRAMRAAAPSPPPAPSPIEGEGFIYRPIPFPRRLGR
jgi:hypothetical protein